MRNLSIFHSRSFTTCIVSVSFVSRMTACVFVLMSNHWVWISRIFLTFAPRIRAVSFSALCTLVSLTSVTCWAGRHDYSLFCFFSELCRFEKFERESIQKSKKISFFSRKIFFILRKIFFFPSRDHDVTTGDRW